MSYPRPILILLPLLLLPSPAHSAEVVLEPVSAEETGLSEAMRVWGEWELKEQGGKYQSHGWWPWGLRAFDFDNDGDLDLLASHHGLPGSMVLRNELRETGKLRFTDCTKSLGVAHRELPSADDRPWIWDFDGDGFLDIASLSDESRKSMVWNRGGKEFEVDPAGTSFHPISHPEDVTDINGDGHPDLDGGSRGYRLFLPETSTFEHIQEPRHAPPANLPEGLVDLEAEIRATGANNRFFSLKIMRQFINGYDTLGHSPLPIDLNRDGLGDTIFAGQGGYGGTYLGRYLLQAADGSLADRGEQLGLPNEGCPIYFGDLTGDGHADLLIAGEQTGGFYENTGPGKFTARENALTPFLRKRGPYLLRAFPADFDHDGLIDLLLSNPRLGRTTVYQNVGGGEFREILNCRGWDSNPNVICDLNNDGLLDVVVGGPTNTEITVFLNKTADPGRFARIAPRMESPNPYAVDAVVSIFAAGGLAEKEAKPLHIHKANWDGTPIHLGLGNREEYDLRIEFPGGKQVEHAKVASNKGVRVTPDGKIVYEEF